MSIAENIKRISDAKADIKSAIEEKGVTVGDAHIEEYADKIRKMHTSIGDSASGYRYGKYIAGSVTSIVSHGTADFALDWHPCLIEMSNVEGEEAKRPIGWLKDNNWLRFEDGSFAPVVGITEEQRAECDVELYLDAEHTQKYCDAGAFDAEEFYNTYKFTQKLYDTEGNEVRILRPWETTRTDLSVFVARKDTIMLVDYLTGESEDLIKGVHSADGAIDGVQGIALPPTGINPDPITTYDDKARCFFFDYVGKDTGTRGLSPLGDITIEGDGFEGNGYYPRTSPEDAYDDEQMNQYGNAIFARANNADALKSYPFAEGGYHALNVFQTCLEAAYSTKYLHSASMFSAGIASNENGNNESNWKNYGGVRLKLTSATTWTYAQWSNSAHAIYNTASAARSNLSETLNNHGAKMMCCEAQIAMSMAVEMNIAPNVQYNCYGRKYWYIVPTGTTAPLSGKMNARLYRIKTMIVNGFNSGGAAAKWNVECCLRTPLALGVNLCGDFYTYQGGGMELVQLNTTTTMYAEEDQKKWHAPLAIAEQNSDYDFQTTYRRIGAYTGTTTQFVWQRMGYTPYRLNSTNGTISTGECYYLALAALSGNNTNRARVAVRVRGGANYTFCSPRSCGANSLTSRTYRSVGGSAQVLIDTQ